MPPASAPEPPPWVATLRLTLIGTVHRGAGFAPLRQLLDSLRPDVVTLEMSSYALAFRRERGAMLRRRLLMLLTRLATETGQPLPLLLGHPEIVDIFRLLAIPFEYRAAAAYARGFSLPLELIDSSVVSARKLRLVESELLTPENLRLLISLPTRSEGVEGVAAARTFVLGTPDPAVRLAFLARRRGNEEIGKRDRHMAEAIRACLAPGRHLVHIGGWVHLVDDPQGETLFSHLGGLSPRRIILDVRK